MVAVGAVVSPGALAALTPAAGSGAVVTGHAAVDWGVVLVFTLVYIGMFLGGLPRLRLDRAGVALLGAIAVIGLGALDTARAAGAVDLPTILLLFSFMVVSAQMRLGGFYGAVTRGVAALPLSPGGLLAALVLVAGGLSAVFSNDVVCLAMTPMVARLCIRRGLPPVPFLVGLACAANIGSGATLIGNPQNMLIGSVMQVPFGAYLHRAAAPVGLSLLVLWAGLVLGPLRGLPCAPVPGQALPPEVDGDLPLDRWQTAKGLGVALALMAVFLLTDWPREVAALVGAGVLLLSRRFHSSEVMSYVDWELLVLFMGLFVVNHAFEATGLAAQAVAWLAVQGLSLGSPGPLLVLGTGLSNLVSNVPAVMLLLPHLPRGEPAVLLALVSTFAGNLLLVGSIANLIVADLAQAAGVQLDWRAHARIGLPVTAASLAIVWVWMTMGP